jgi:hypothetical protein
LLLYSLRGGDVHLQVFAPGGEKGKKDFNNRVFSMGIFEGHRKVPIRWLQGDSEFPFGAFLLSANEIFPKLTNFSSIPKKSKSEGENEHV